MQLFLLLLLFLAYSRELLISFSANFTLTLTHNVFVIVVGGRSLKIHPVRLLLSFTKSTPTFFWPPTHKSPKLNSSRRLRAARALERQQRERSLFSARMRTGERAF